MRSAQREDLSIQLGTFWSDSVAPDGRSEYATFAAHRDCDNPLIPGRTRCRNSKNAVRIASDDSREKAAALQWRGATARAGGPREFRARAGGGRPFRRRLAVLRRKARA